MYGKDYTNANPIKHELNQIESKKCELPELITSIY